MTEIERPAPIVLSDRIGSGERRDAVVAAEAERALATPPKVLDAAVTDATYLLGDGLTVADLNLASILGWARQARIDLAAFRRTEAWLKLCHNRPAAQRAQQLQREG